MKWVAFLMAVLVGGCAGCLKKSETRPAPVSQKPPAAASPAPAAPADATRRIRRAQMAGSWYSENKDQLAAEVDGLFREAKAPKIDGKVIALISPHAGYRFSGKAAATNYQLLRGQDVRRVVLLAISHHYPLRGASIPDVTDFETPLGLVPVDGKAVARLRRSPVVSSVMRAEEGEHSLEIQLPLLQRALPRFSLVPILVGRMSDQDYVDLAAALAEIVDSHTVVVASSDFTHRGVNYGYEVPAGPGDVQARLARLDQGSIDQITKLSRPGLLAYAEKTGTTICGLHPIALLLELLGRFPGSKPHVVSHYTSGDVTSDWSSSVTYIGMAFTGKWREEFITMHPDSVSVDDARAQAEALEWKEATSADTKASYEKYLSKHPAGAHSGEARSGVKRKALLSIKHVVLRTSSTNVRGSTDSSFGGIRAAFLGSEDQIRPLAVDHSVRDALVRLNVLVVENGTGEAVLEVICSRTLRCDVDTLSFDARRMPNPVFGLDYRCRVAVSADGETLATDSVSATYEGDSREVADPDKAILAFEAASARRYYVLAGEALEEADGRFAAELKEHLARLLRPAGPLSDDEKRTLLPASVSPTARWVPGPLSDDEKRTLLRLARLSLEASVRKGRFDPEGIKSIPVTPSLERKAGAFVTLKCKGGIDGTCTGKGDELRGCIGTLEPSSSVYEVVSHRAASAALEDTRFPHTVTVEELPFITVEVSVLTPPRPVKSAEEIVIGRHGIILSLGWNRATFLPQVAPEQGWDRETTLRHLAQKAGLPAEAWKKAEYQVYEAIVFSEGEFK